jgi:hypothetical protein
MTYDPVNDRYICEAGGLLLYHSTRQQSGNTLKIYHKYTDCTDCPFKSRCMVRKNAKRRTLSIVVGDNIIGQVLERFEDPAYQRLYHQRAHNIETVFAFVRTVLKFDRWSVRGKHKVAAEGGILRAAYQLRKLHAAM